MDRQALEQALMRLLAAREHTRAELRGKLASRCAEPQLLEQVIDELRERGLQSDGRFAEQYVSSRMRRGFGPLRIRRELQERGVEAPLLEASLDEQGAAWFELLRETHRRKYGAGLPGDFKERARRARFLEYRGFPAEMIRRLLWSEEA